MFMPDESFFRCALEVDPSLIEVGVDAGVIFASPMTLIGLLRTVAYTWQQETIAESARIVSGLGRELYERLGTFAKHFSKVGRNLDTAVGAYNEAVGSLETRVLVTARKLEQHGASIGELPEVAPLSASRDRWSPRSSATSRRCASCRPPTPPSCSSARARRSLRPGRAPAGPG